MFYNRQVTRPRGAERKRRVIGKDILYYKYAREAGPKGLASLRYVREGEETRVSSP